MLIIGELAALHATSYEVGSQEIRSGSVPVIDARCPGVIRRVRAGRHCDFALDPCRAISSPEFRFVLHVWT